MSRYKITSDWTTEETAVIPINYGQDAVTVIHEVADIKDTRGGWEYREGAHRVKATTNDGRTYTGKHVTGRSKTFYGESAWSNAERLFGDLVTSGRFDR